jgi:hypothetical protein
MKKQVLKVMNARQSRMPLKVAASLRIKKFVRNVIWREDIRLKTQLVNVKN